MSEPQPCLYLCLPPRPADDLIPLVEAALATGLVACVRFDLGPAPEEDWVRAANLLIEPCHGADVALVITDHYRLVEQLGLDGVHLANSRTPLREVRKALGPDRIVGAWAGASKHQGMVLAEAGADYVSLGPVGDTGALGAEEQAGADLFKWWAEMIETPVVAEGGLAPADTAHLAAIIDFAVPGLAIWDDPDSFLDQLRAHAAPLLDISD